MDCMSEAQAEEYGSTPTIVDDYIKEPCGGTVVFALSEWVNVMAQRSYVERSSFSAACQVPGLIALQHDERDDHVALVTDGEMVPVDAQLGKVGAQGLIELQHRLAEPVVRDGDAA